MGRKARKRNNPQARLTTSHRLNKIKYQLFAADRQYGYGVILSASEDLRRGDVSTGFLRHFAYVPRTIDNVARLLVESTTDDLPTLIARIQPELDKLIAAKMVARIGDQLIDGSTRTRLQALRTRLETAR